MSSLDQVVKQVLNSVRSKGSYITKALAHFVVETLYNPDTKRFYSEDYIDTEKAELMTKKCVQLIENMDAEIDFRTMKLQISRIVLTKNMKRARFNRRTNSQKNSKIILENPLN